MSNLATVLLESASAVASLGPTIADIEILDDASVQAGLGLVRDHRRALQAYELALAAQIAKRSDHTLGYGGLARRNGSATPAAFIQSVTGSSIEEARKLAHLGQSLADADADAAAQSAEADPAAAVAPIVAAALSGGISLDAADAIRRGLGKPDPAICATDLAAAALIARAAGMTPEELLKAARRVRNELDLASVERGAKQRASLRYVRLWQRDGMSGGSWALPDEDGGLEIRTALKLLIAKKTNGPRFADISKDSPTSADTAAALHDERTPEHIMADGFNQIFHAGLSTDPRIVPGAGRAPVRIIVTDATLASTAPNESGTTEPDAIGPGTTPIGSAILEETLTPVSAATLEENLCAGGTTTVAFDQTGNPLDVGREQRLFTTRQRAALAVRDGGCRFPGCEKPPSWTEAHHIDYWKRDTGTTSIANGILLCRYHHMLIHNTGWNITKNPAKGPGSARSAESAGGNYQLTPPKERDPHQKPINMPSKNPLIAAMTHPPATGAA
jgi:Domain of unknown function (DUF222)